MFLVTFSFFLFSIDLFNLKIWISLNVWLCYYMSCFAPARTRCMGARGSASGTTPAAKIQEYSPLTFVNIQLSVFLFIFYRSIFLSISLYLIHLSILSINISIFIYLLSLLIYAFEMNMYLHTFIYSLYSHYLIF